jgi:hypothetical protein
MQALMLDPRFKSLILIFNSFIGSELGVAIATKYDRKSLYSTLLILITIYIHYLKLKVLLLINLMKTIVWISLKW